MAKITQINVDMNLGTVNGQYLLPTLPGAYPPAVPTPMFFTLPIDVVLAAAATVKAIEK